MELQSVGSGGGVEREGVARVVGAGLGVERLLRLGGGLRAVQGASVEVVAKRYKRAKSLGPVFAAVGDNVDIA